MIHGSMSRSPGSSPHHLFRRRKDQPCQSTTEPRSGPKAASGLARELNTGMNRALGPNRVAPRGDTKLGRRRIGVCLLSLFIAIVMMPPASLCQTQVSLTPLLIPLSAAPGEVRDFEITIANDGNRGTAEFRAFVADVTQDIRGAYRVAEPGSSHYSCAQWIRLSDIHISLAAGSGAVVKGRLSVPRGVSGGRYAAVVFELAPEDEPEAADYSVSRLFQRFVTVIELSIPSPRDRKDLCILGFSSTIGSTPSVSISLPDTALTLSARVRNQGNTHVYARATLTLRDSAGRRLRQIPLGSGRGLVLPETTVELASILPAGLSPGSYTADITIHYGGSRPALAKIPFAVGEAESAVAPSDTVRVAQAVDVTPSEISVQCPAGASAVRSLVVHNPTDQVLHVKTEAVPLAYDINGDLAVDDTLDGRWSCAGWMELRPSEFDIRPHSKQVVRMIVPIPRGEEGGRYALIVFSSMSASGDPIADAREAMTQTGVPLFLTVGKQVISKVELAPIEIRDGGPSVGLIFETVVSNTGSIHAMPRATLSIKKREIPTGLAGVEFVGKGSLTNVYSVDLGPTEGYVLPGGSRVLQVPIGRALEKGDYVVEIEVDYGAKQLVRGEREFQVK